MNPIQTHELQWYSAALALAWIGLTMLAIYLYRTKVNIDRGVWIILGVAIVARIALLFSLPPMLSDDIWRYLHDGQTLASGQNPYAQSPKDAGGDVERINHAHLVTIYQPTSQYVFAGLASVSLNERAFRFGFIIFDLLAILLLIVALREAGKSVWWSAMYAWHPLAITEIAWSGHQDAIGIALLVAALLCAERCVKQAKWCWLGGIAFAMCIAVKPIVAPLAIPMVWRLRKQPSAIVSGFSATLVTLAMLYLPFVFAPGGLTGMFETIETFIDDWAFNSSVHASLQAALGSKMAADRAAGVLLAIVLCAATFTAKNLWQSAMVFMFAALLLSNTVHPWYVLWLAAVLPLAWCWAGWVFTISVALSYTALLEPKIFKPLPWAWRIEYGMVASAVVVEVAAMFWRYRRPADAARS